MSARLERLVERRQAVKARIEELHEQRREILAEAERAGSEYLSAGQDAEFRDISSQLQDLENGNDERGVVGIRQYDERIAELSPDQSPLTPGAQVVRGMSGTGEAPERPLYGLGEGNLRSVWEAVSRGRVVSVREERAAVTSAQFGAPGAWGTVAAAPAVSLRAFSGIPNRNLDGMTAQVPSLTLPAGAAGATETAANTEVTGVADVSLATSRYGAWTQVSAAVRTFDDLRALNSAQSVHIARSLNLTDIARIDSDAGTATTFNASTLDKDLRTAILTVAAAAGVGPADVVVYGQPAALALASSWAPTNAQDRASYLVEVFGAKVYSTLQAAANKLTVFVPTAYVCFQTGIDAATTIDPTDGSMRFGQWLHSTPVAPAIVGAAKSVATA